ncbi:MAG TPA: helix-turn-helix domain-containing protein, partial [Burkholderiaceae bacterium]|nr:helix-turn-helix domain-containing protein [Burkholderiaceae bacterium]
MSTKDDTSPVSDFQTEARERNAPARRVTRSRSAKTTRENILRAAKKIFSKDGYDGARVEKISKAAKSYDSLIYYYFGSKEKLFVEVLEGAY